MYVPVAYDRVSSAVLFVLRRKLMGAVGKAEGEGYFRSVAEALLGIMWTAEANGALDFANTRCYEYTGLNTEETIGSGWEQVLHPDDLAVTVQKWAMPFKAEMDMRSNIAFGGPMVLTGGFWEERIPFAAIRGQSSSGLGPAPTLKIRSTTSRFWRSRSRRARRSWLTPIRGFRKRCVNETWPAKNSTGRTKE